MAAPRSPQHTEWQSARVPKLSYRKPLPQDELDKINQAPREYVPQVKPVVRTISVRETNDRPAGPSSSQVSQAPPRKKSSILSGFFSKEPTISALAQVEADLTAKHGAATPQSVPLVSSRKMPEHVPKVNSRWDGIPETVKLREREEKQRKRLSQHGLSTSTQYHIQSGNSDESIHDTMSTQQTQSRRDSDTASHPDSWQSRNGTSAKPQRHESFSSAASSNASAEAKHRQTASVKSQSLRSPSGSSLPEITSFFQHQAHKANQSPPVPRATRTTRAQPVRANTARSDTTSIEAIPEHSSSPVATPRETSPATPVYHADREGSRGMMGSNAKSTGAIGNKRTTTRNQHVPIDAFLAGEARPVELDDDDDDDDDNNDDDDSTNTTLRTNLPIRPSQTQQQSRVKANVAGTKQALRGRPDTVKIDQVNRNEAAPWEIQEPISTKTTTVAATTLKTRVPKALAVFK